MKKLGIRIQKKLLVFVYKEPLLDRKRIKVTTLINRKFVGWEFNNINPRIIPTRR